MGLTCKYFYNLVSVLLYPTLLLMHFDTSAIFCNLFHLQYILELSLSVYLVAQLCLTLCDPRGLWPARLSRLIQFPYFHYISYFPCKLKCILLCYLKKKWKPASNTIYIHSEPFILSCSSMSPISCKHKIFPLHHLHLHVETLQVLWSLWK